MIRGMTRHKSDRMTTAASSLEISGVALLVDALFEPALKLTERAAESNEFPRKLRLPHESVVVCFARKTAEPADYNQKCGAYGDLQRSV